jgi:hypothetical protein
MKQIAISLVIALAFAFGLPTLIGLVVYANSEAIVPNLLYWPLSVTDKLGFTDCADANLVSEKLTCAETGLFVDAVFYPLTVLVCAYVAHRVFFRRKVGLRASPVT